MKKGILLILLFSFAGVSLVGCPDWFGGGDDSAESVAQKAKDIAGEAKTAAEKEKTDNPDADHSVCDEAIGEADAAIAAADAAIQEEKDAQDEDAKTAAKDNANTAKTNAENAKKKAEGCAKDGGGGDDDCKQESGSVKCTHATEKYPADHKFKPNEPVSATATYILKVSGNCENNYDQFIDNTGNTCRSKTEGECQTAKDDWVKAKEAEGYTCE